jgi:DNA gyrase inhibitor GyrI
VARQRMERAVMYMQIEEISLTRLAEKVGYDNPQSFSKAFKKQFGTSPKTYMNELQARLKTYVKSESNYLPSEICEEDDLDLVYIRIIGKYGDSEPYEAAWQKLVAFLMNQQAFSETTRFIGISFDDPNVTRPDRCRFYACASVRKNIAPTGEFGTIRLRKGKYAVYTLKGSYSGLKDLYNNINVNFDYVLRYGIAFEEYMNSPDNTKEEDLLTKIFIPVK